MFYVSRFKDIQKQEYECEVITPMFLGGADPKEAELRVPPIKAAMRFWWRALYQGANVEQMAKDEASIFGSTERKAVVSIRLSYTVKPILKDLPAGKMVPVKGKPFPTSIINYLSYGLFEYKKDLRKNVYNREHIAPETIFKLAIHHPRDTESDVVKSLKALISFGGLGARSRNGFGSIHCDDLVEHAIRAEGGLKSFSAFSHDACLFNHFNTHDKWVDALSEIGALYREARLKLEPRHTWNERAFIAMPIEAQRENIPHSIRSGRHAKPYFLHVNKTLDGKYQGQILFLPYLYKAGPNEKADRFKEYMDACGKMNEAITKGMGGSK